MHGYCAYYDTLIGMVNAILSVNLEIFHKWNHYRQEKGLTQGHIAIGFALTLGPQLSICSIKHGISIRVFFVYYMLIV